MPKVHWTFSYSFPRSFLGGCQFCCWPDADIFLQAHHPFIQFLLSESQHSNSQYSSLKEKLLSNVFLTFFLQFSFIDVLDQSTFLLFLNLLLSFNYSIIDSVYPIPMIMIKGKRKPILKTVILFWSALAWLSVNAIHIWAPYMEIYSSDFGNIFPSLVFILKLPIFQPPRAFWWEHISLHWRNMRYLKMRLKSLYSKL